MSTFCVGAASSSSSFCPSIHRLFYLSLAFLFVFNFHAAAARNETRKLARREIKNQNRFRARFSRGRGIREEKKKSRRTDGTGKMAAWRRDATRRRRTLRRRRRRRRRTSDFSESVPQVPRGETDRIVERPGRESCSVESCPEVDGCPATAGLGRGTSSFGTSSARRESPRPFALGALSSSFLPPFFSRILVKVPPTVLPRRDCKLPPEENSDRRYLALPRGRSSSRLIGIAVSRNCPTASPRMYNICRVIFVKIYLDGDVGSARVCQNERG